MKEEGVHAEREMVLVIGTAWPLRAETALHAERPAPPAAGRPAWGLHLAGQLAGGRGYVPSPRPPHDLRLKLAQAAYYLRDLLAGPPSALERGAGTAGARGSVLGSVFLGHPELVDEFLQPRVGG